MNHLSLSITLILFSLSLNACSTTARATAPANPYAASEPIIDLSAIDESVDPCEDFYHYACGTWIKNFTLPADKALYNRQTDGLELSTQTTLSSVLEAYSKGDYHTPSKNSAKLGAFYSSCMNTTALEHEAPAFIQKQFSTIDAIQSTADLPEVVARLHLSGVGVFFNFYSQPDYANSNQVIGFLDQGGTSLPERGYYFKKDKKSIETRTKYVAHVNTLLNLAGEPTTASQQNSKALLAFETALEKNALALQDMQDSTKLNHPMTLNQVQKLVPHFNFKKYFDGIGVTALNKINVTHPQFYAGFDALLAKQSLASIKNYLKWQILHHYASALSDSFVQEDFNFWNHYLAGQAAPLPRWKKCMLSTGGNMRDALAEAYVNTFSNAAEIRKNTNTMINEIIQAFDQNLDTLDWLDQPTRAAAKAKLAKVTNKVGYPNHWEDFTPLTINTSYLDNLREAAAFNERIDLRKIGKPTDRTLWDMAPWEQNAYYNPPANEMVFPLGALVPPIFDLNASTGANFGSIGGGWMGHELTHGFDSDGSHYDGDGNLKNWWSKTTSDDFTKRTQCLVDQGNQYEILPGLKVNGKQTLTENLADQGGVKMGYVAFVTATTNRTPAPDVGKFNERQQYWLAYGQSWCTKETAEHIRLQVSSNVHPPNEFRANDVLFNRPEFAKDFSCKAGSRMAPVNRCAVW